MNFLLTGVETKRLTFRPLAEISFDAWLPFFRDTNNAKFLALEHLPTPEDQCTMWFERVHKRIADGQGGLNALLDRDRGEYVGQCGLQVQEVDGRMELEVGYSLLPAYLGQGYAIEAARKCRDVAFERGYSKTLISVIHVDNEPSKVVARKNGMQLDRTTLFRGTMPVDIFRIDRKEWEQLQGPQSISPERA